MDVPRGHLVDLLPCLVDDQQKKMMMNKTRQLKAGALFVVVEWMVLVTVEPYTKVAWHSMWL